MELQPSKNAECQCRSGEKYKKCCMGKISKKQEEYFGLLQKQARIKDKLMNWCMAHFPEDELNNYFYEFAEKNLREAKNENEITAFFDWFFLDARHKPTNEKILSLVRRDFSYLFDADELAIIDEWHNNTQAGIYEIIELNPQFWQTIIREIFTKKEFTIIDRRLSQIMIKGDIIFSRLQKIFDNYYLSGVGNNYSRAFHLERLKNFVMLQYNNKKETMPNLTYEEFMNANGNIISKWKPEMPKIMTAGREEAKLCEATYLLNLAAIDNILSWFDKNKKDFMVTDIDFKNDTFKSANIACLYNRDIKDIAESKESGLIYMLQVIDERGKAFPTLGSIQIKKNKLIIFSTSETKFKEIRKKLENNIGQHLTFVKEDIKEVEQALAKKASKSEKEYHKADKKDEMQEIAKPILEAYYKQWCYQKIPALGNITPKQALKTEEGRKALKELLLTMENDEQHKKREEKEYIPVEKIIRDELGFYD